jgi:hypothetical protein
MDKPLFYTQLIIKTIIVPLQTLTNTTAKVLKLFGICKYF